MAAWSTSPPPNAAPPPAPIRRRVLEAGDLIVSGTAEVLKDVRDSLIIGLTD